MNHHYHIHSMNILSNHHNHPPPRHSLPLPLFSSQVPLLPCPLSHLHFYCYFCIHLVHFLNLNSVVEGFQAKY